MRIDQVRYQSRCSRLWEVGGFILCLLSAGILVYFCFYRLAFRSKFVMMRNFLKFLESDSECIVSKVSEYDSRYHIHFSKSYKVTISNIDVEDKDVMWYLIGPLGELLIYDATVDFETIRLSSKIAKELKRIVKQQVELVS